MLQPKGLEMARDPIVVSILDLAHLLDFASLELFYMAIYFTFFQFIFVFALLNHALLSLVFLLIELNFFLAYFLCILLLEFQLFLSSFSL